MPGKGAGSATETSNTMQLVSHRACLPTQTDRNTYKTQDTQRQEEY